VIINARRPVLITGGAGFIGTNLAHRLLCDGQPVLILDDLSRAGVADNLRWLEEHHGGRLEVVVGDVRDAELVRQAVNRAGAVFHFAAQVAVTTSLKDPLHDFAVNAGGTLNVLEAIRAAVPSPPLLYTSTNKVYGGLQDVPLALIDGRYAPEDPCLRAAGIGERQPLDFHSPYGCSKGAADQYVLDYARVYRLPALVFRMSCIYGSHQRGNEDQGWLAHFVLCALRGEPITIYGDGHQVRDALHVDDLVDAMLKAIARVEVVAGRAFNLGGGPANTVTLNEALAAISRLHGQLPPLRSSGWRQGDQRYYVSDIRAFQRAADWRPRIGVVEGLGRLYAELRQTREDLRPRAQAAGGSRS
jgi:CDP-paratose 2-epimerase